MAIGRGIDRGRGLLPKKRLGQHFLMDRGVIHEIVARAGFDKDQTILEIGPGLGALTLPLAHCVKQLIAVEKDPRLTDRLRQKLSREGLGNVTLINDDILKMDLFHLLGPAPNRTDIIGNLPYNISSPFLEQFINNRALLSRAILMFQAEFAKRLTAIPGNRSYGAMTVMIQYHAGITPLLDVSKEAFYPRPKVDSMVLELDLNRPHPRRAEDEKGFRMVVKGAFAHRRKTLLNSFKGSFPSQGVNRILLAMEKCDIDPRSRAETLGIDDFLCLASAFTLS